jgi:hypothetical protein
MPWLPTNCDLPPTLKSLMNSICNYGKEEKTNIYNLAKGSRTTIFNFDYPLSDKVNREDFEVMILNHFIHRRIGFDTPTEFRIALNVKLNEIMPRYNKLFDMLDGWDLYSGGETTTRVQTDNGTNTLNNTINANNTNISDRRNSQMPQNEIQDVKDGNYMTDYNYDTNTDSGTTVSDTSGTNTNTTNETITRSPSDKIRIYKEFMENVNNIYSLIFKDLDSLFYGLV